MDLVKLSKEEVEFEHPAMGKHYCADCTHYQKALQKCQIVAGRIRPEDWCNRYKERD